MSVITRNLMMAAGQGNEPVTTVFVSTGAALISVGVSDLSSPTKASELSVDLNGGRLVYSKKRNHVFVTTKGDNEIISIDVSDPASMSVSQTLSIPGEALALALDNDSDTLYWLRKDNGYFYSYDVSDPSSMAQSDVLVSVGLTSAVSGAIALDLRSKRALVSSGKVVTNGFHQLSLVDISDPASMTKLDDSTRSTDELNGGYSKVALDVNSKTVYWSSERYTTTNSYSADTIGAGSSGGDNGALLGLSYFRKRDSEFFDGEISSSNILMTFDDYRLAGFSVINGSPDELKCYDLSDPASPVVLGSLADGAFNYTGNAIADVSGPAGTYAYK